MARPSQNIDQALLASGRLLYPQLGVAGLSVRQICEHAGANVGMFHYHFQSKNNYVAALLQGQYDELYEQLAAQAAQQGAVLERLRAALCLLGRLIRQHGKWIQRIWADAGLGEEVARQFLQRNAPRHIGLLMALLEEAAQTGELAPMPPMQRLGFLMGSVLTPMVLLPAAMQLQLLPTQLATSVETDVFSDAAIADRVQRALTALALPANPATPASISPTP